MVTTVLGKVAVTPKGEWNGTTAYEKLDVVSYGGSSYLSVRDVPAGTSLSNTNYWMLLAQKGDTGNAIASIEKTATSGLTDTYTITFTNGNTTTFTVTNGEAATVIVGTVTTGAEGTAVVITNSGDEHDAVLNFTIPRGNTGNGIQGIELTGTSGGVKTYTITFTDGETFSFDVTDGEVTETRLAEALEDYALTDGYYEDLVAGGSEQLLSSVYEEDSEPYLFRTSGGSMDIGDREEDTIVGGTVAWNQLFDSVDYTNNAVDTRANLLFMVQATTPGMVLYSGSVTEPKTIEIVFSSSTDSGGVRMKHNGQTTDFVFAQNAQKGVISNHKYLARATFTGVDVQTVGGIVGKNFQLFDLTQMFGTTIADYIYSLETATAGAGVAWFKKLFPKPYYEYNAGELLSVEGLQSHDMTGFNQWDEEWEVGGYSDSGAKTSDNNRIRNKNLIPVLPSTAYYSNISWLFEYDASQTFIQKQQGNRVITTSQNTAYINFMTNTAYGTTYNNDICINLSWDGERDGEYEPYVKRSYLLDDSLTLRGIPKLDENNKLRCDGDVYHADGTVERKYGIVDLGTLNWSKYVSSGDGNIYFQSVGGLPLAKGSSVGAFKGIISNDYTIVGSSGLIDKGVAIGPTSKTLFIKDSAYSSESATAFKTAMSGVYLVYELETPTTEQAEPYQTPQIVDDFGTEEYVTDSIVPVGHNTKYMPNLKAKLEMAPDSPSENGDYVVRHTDGHNAYVPLVIPTELPTAPSEDGTYHLKLTVANGTATLAWEAE